MEERVEDIQVQQSPPSQFDSCNETNQGNVTVERNHSAEDAKAVRSEDGKYQDGVKDKNSISDADLETKSSHEKQEISSHKKGKGKAKAAWPKHVTVPQPFSLATEKRMSSRQRRAVSESDGPVPNPTLPKATSFISKNRTQTSQRVERSTELTHGTTTAQSSKSAAQHSHCADKPTGVAHKTKGKIQVEEGGSKESRVTGKEEKELDIKKLLKDSVKLSPLPSFNSKKAPPNPELRNIPLTRPKSPPVLHQRSRSISETHHRRSKSVSELSSKKTDVCNRSTGTRESGNNKMEGIARNGSKTTSANAASTESKIIKPEALHKNTSRTISSSAKDAINRLLRGSWKASNTQSRASVKSGKSCGSGLVKGGVISSDEGKCLAVVIS